MDLETNFGDIVLQFTDHWKYEFRYDSELIDKYGIKLQVRTKLEDISNIYRVHFKAKMTLKELANYFSLCVEVYDDEENYIFKGFLHGWPDKWSEEWMEFFSGAPYNEYESEKED